MTGEVLLDPRSALGPRRVAIPWRADRAAYLAAAGLGPDGRLRETARPPALPTFARLLADGLGRGHLDTSALMALVGSEAPRAAQPDHGALAELVTRAALAQRLEPALVLAVVQAESGFNPRAVSPAGAKGLMQLMDGTARALGVRDPFDPVENVVAGTRYLRQMLDRFGDERLALAAYNAGPGAVQRYGGIPPYPETQRYVTTVLALRERLRAARR